jgi:hypothetical protein
MKFTTLFARCAIASAALLAVAGAHASVVVTSKYSAQMTAVSNFNLPSGNGLQVPVWQVNDNGTDWLAFCIDPTTSMDLKNKANSYVADSTFSGFDNNTSVQRLYSLYYTDTLSKSTALSFQLALWELYNDDGSLTTGAFKGLNGPASSKLIINESASMLLAARADTAFTPKYDFTSYTTAGSQTIVTANLVSAVPEPSTYAMMGLGLAAMGLVARRRKQD